MNDILHYSFNQIHILVVIVLLLIGAGEVGFWAGRRSDDKNNEALRAQIGSIQASMLGLLALLLGFTFSMAAGRFDLRRNLVSEEANAAGTTYLRAGLIPAHRDAARAQLRRYVSARIDANPAEWAAAQQQLWALAEESAKDTRSIPAGLYAQALNNLIDAQGRRDNADFNIVPEIIFYILAGCGMIALGVTGYASGLTAGRQFVLRAFLAGLIGLVMTLILDLDRPNRGLIQIRSRPLIELRDSWNPQVE